MWEASLSGLEGNDEHSDRHAFQTPRFRDLDFQQSSRDLWLIFRNCPWQEVPSSGENAENPE